MKKVRLITDDKFNGIEAISRTPLRNRYFFAGAWHEVELKEIIDVDWPVNPIKSFIKPEILRDAQIIETVEAVYAEMTNTFDIMYLIQRVECEMPTKKHEATIQRQLCQLRQYGKLNYEVVDEKKGTYRKLPVVSKTCAEQVKMDFQPDWKKRFVEFLKKEGAYNEYMGRLKQWRTEPFSTYFTNIEREGNIEILISGAFSWPVPDIRYWNDLNLKWRAIYNGK